MSKKIKILAFAGSLRADSFNKKLVKVALKGAESAGADVTYIDLNDFTMPVYDGDIESKSGLPENAKKFKKLLIEHDGFLISCPEYNSSISGALKNAIDWASRSESPEEKSLVAFTGKTAGLLSASPGALGGLRGLVHVRAILGNIGVLVLPAQVAVSKADEAFDAKGAMVDKKKEASVQKIAADLVKLTQAFQTANA